MDAQTPPPDDEHDDANRQRNFVLAMAAVGVIVGLGLFLVGKMWQNEKMQECLMSGRRDCAPIDVPDSR